MTIYDAILINLYRTRLYLPLLIIFIGCLAFPGTVRIKDKIASYMSNISTWKIALAISLLAFILGIFCCYDGKSWGGDWSQYFAQARALATNSVDQWYQKNIYIIDTSSEGVGSDVYPWIWAILLVPVYRLIGDNFAILKIYEAFFWGIILHSVSILY